MAKMSLQSIQTRISRLIWVFTLTLIFAYGGNSLRAAELMVNGSFESGSFTGWTTTNASNPFILWNISGSGAGGGFTPVPVVTQPQDGTKVAWQGVACNAGSSFILSQDVALPAATTAQLRWRDRFQDNLSEFCGGSGEPVCGTVIYRVDVLTTGNVLLQNLRLVTALPNSNTDTGWHIYIANLSAFAGQTVRIRFMTTPTVTWDGPGQLEVDAVSLQAPAVTTAANVTVGGRVLTASGAGISKAAISMDDGTGNTRTARTNPFGYYTFDEVPAGRTYVISISDKRYQFVNPTRVVTINDSLADLDFTALP
jgi:hypothetical protein